MSMFCTFLVEVAAADRSVQSAMVFHEYSQMSKAVFTYATLRQRCCYRTQSQRRLKTELSVLGFCIPCLAPNIPAGEHISARAEDYIVKTLASLPTRSNPSSLSANKLYTSDQDVAFPSVATK